MTTGSEARMRIATLALNDAKPEALVLGAMLIDPDATAKAASMVKSEHFPPDATREVFDACVSLWRDGVGVDLLTVTRKLRDGGKLDAVGGAWQVAEYARRVASSAHLEWHCAALREDFSLRVLREAGLKAAQGGGKGGDPSAIISSLSHELARAAVTDVDEGVNAGERAYELLNNPPKTNPIHLGIEGLDDMVFLLDGNMVTISADAGTGKTALVLSVILNLVDQRKTWFVSLEMSADEVVRRALAQIALVDIDRVMLDRLSDDERSRLGVAASTYAKMLSRILIHDSGSMSVDEFAAKAEHKVKHEGVRLIALDYAQLMDYDTKLWKTKADGFEAISKGIRAVGRKLNVPILCVVHVNKEGKEHGSIQFEKDAHVRLNLSREMGQPSMTVNILKNRNGRPGKTTVPCEMQWGIVGRQGPPHWTTGAKPQRPTSDEAMPF